MICDHDPSIERMKSDLAGGGWTHAGPFYTDLCGRTFLGPHKAWHIWHGGFEEWQEIEAERIRSPK